MSSKFFFNPARNRQEPRGYCLFNFIREFVTQQPSSFFDYYLNTFFPDPRIDGQISSIQPKKPSQLSFALKNKTAEATFAEDFSVLGDPKEFCLLFRNFFDKLNDSQKNCLRKALLKLLLVEVDEKNSHYSYGHLIIFLAKRRLFLVLDFLNNQNPESDFSLFRKIVVLLSIYAIRTEKELQAAVKTLITKEKDTEYVPDATPVPGATPISTSNASAPNVPPTPQQVLLNQTLQPSATPQPAAQQPGAPIIKPGTTSTATPASNLPTPNPQNAASAAANAKYVSSFSKFLFAKKPDEPVVKPVATPTVIPMTPQVPQVDKKVIDKKKKDFLNFLFFLIGIAEENYKENETSNNDAVGRKRSNSNAAQKSDGYLSSFYKTMIAVKPETGAPQPKVPQHPADVLLQNIQKQLPSVNPNVVYVEGMEEPTPPQLLVLSKDLQLDLNQRKRPKPKDGKDPTPSTPSDFENDFNPTLCVMSKSYEKFFKVFFVEKKIPKTLKKDVFLVAVQKHGAMFVWKWDSAASVWKQFRLETIGEVSRPINPTFPVGPRIGTKSVIAMGSYSNILGWPTQPIDKICYVEPLNLLTFVNKETNFETIFSCELAFFMHCVQVHPKKKVFSYTSDESPEVKQTYDMLPSKHGIWVFLRTARTIHHFDLTVLQNAFTKALTPTNAGNMISGVGGGTMSEDILTPKSILASNVYLHAFDAVCHPVGEGKNGDPKTFYFVTHCVNPISKELVFLDIFGTFWACNYEQNSELSLKKIGGKFGARKLEENYFSFFGKCGYFTGIGQIETILQPLITFVQLDQHFASLIAKTLEKLKEEKEKQKIEHKEQEHSPDDANAKISASTPEAPKPQITVPNSPAPSTPSEKLHSGGVPSTPSHSSGSSSVPSTPAKENIQIPAPVVVPPEVQEIVTKHLQTLKKMLKQMIKLAVVNLNGSILSSIQMEADSLLKQIMDNFSGGEKKNDFGALIFSKQFEGYFIRCFQKFFGINMQFVENFLIMVENMGNCWFFEPNSCELFGEKLNSSNFFSTNSNFSPNPFVSVNSLSPLSLPREYQFVKERIFSEKILGMKAKLEQFKNQNLQDKQDRTEKEKKDLEKFDKGSTERNEIKFLCRLCSGMNINSTRLFLFSGGGLIDSPSCLFELKTPTLREIIKFIFDRSQQDFFKKSVTNYKDWVENSQNMNQNSQNMNQNSQNFMTNEEEIASATARINSASTSLKKMYSPISVSSNTLLTQIPASGSNSNSNNKKKTGNSSNLSSNSNDLNIQKVGKSWKMNQIKQIKNYVSLVDRLISAIVLTGKGNPDFYKYSLELYSFCSNILPAVVIDVKSKEGGKIHQLLAETQVIQKKMLSNLVELKPQTKEQKKQQIPFAISNQILIYSGSYSFLHSSKALDKSLLNANPLWKNKSQPKLEKNVFAKEFLTAPKSLPDILFSGIPIAQFESKVNLRDDQTRSIITVLEEESKKKKEEEKKKAEEKEKLMKKTNDDIFSIDFSKIDVFVSPK